MGISTKEFAARWHVKAESVVSRLCRKGSYFGIRPRKLENGFLDWPEDKPAPAAAPATEREAA